MNRKVKLLFKKNDIVIYEHEFGIIKEACYMTDTDLIRYDIEHDGILTSGVLEYEIYSPRIIHKEKTYCSKQPLCGNTKEPVYITRHDRYIKCKKCLKILKEEQQ